MRSRSIHTACNKISLKVSVFSLEFRPRTAEGGDLWSRLGLHAPSSGGLCPPSFSSALLPGLIRATHPRAPAAQGRPPRRPLRVLELGLFPVPRGSRRHPRPQPVTTAAAGASPRPPPPAPRRSPPHGPGLTPPHPGSPTRVASAPPLSQPHLRFRRAARKLSSYQALGFGGPSGPAPTAVSPTPRGLAAPPSCRSCVAHTPQ